MAETGNPAPETGRPKTRVPLKIEETLAGVAIAFLALLTFANVVVRYATDFSFAFTEEFSIFLMVLMTLFGASSVMAKNGHLNIAYFVDRLSPHRRRWIRLAATAAVAVTFALLASCSEGGSGGDAGAADCVQSSRGADCSQLCRQYCAKRRQCATPRSGARSSPA